MMKKKIVTVWLCMAMAVSMTACGSGTSKAEGVTKTSSAENDGTDTGSASSSSAETYGSETQKQIMTVDIVDGEYHVEDCIKLGDYKNIALTKTVAEVTDAQVESYMNSMLQPVEVTDADATVQKGDIADIGYVGKIDGKEFEGGSSESYDLEIGSGNFIAGFEDGVIGMKKGETKDLNLKFPENYMATEYAGKDVVFTVTVNAIKQKPIVDDAWVEESTAGQYSTVEEYKMSIREQLESENEDAATSSMQSEAWSKVEESSTYLQIPKEYYDKGVADFESNVAAAAEQYGVSQEEYIKQVGMTEDSYETQKDQYGRYTAASKVLLDALIEAEGLSEKSDEYATELKEVSDLYGVTPDELKEQNGEDNVYMYCMTQIAVQRIIGYAKVTEEKTNE